MKVKIVFPQMTYKTKFVEVNDIDINKLNEAEFIWENLDTSEKEKVIGGLNEIESAAECGYAWIAKVDKN